MNPILMEFAGRQADKGAMSLPESYKQLAVNAQFYLKTRMAGCDVGKRIGEITDFDLNLKKSTVTLTALDFVTSCDAQIAGTYSDDGSFMWAWGHPDTPEPMQQAAWAVQQFGDRQEIEELLSRGGEIDATKLDEYLAVAAFISDADGVYLGDHGGGGKVCILYYLGNQIKGLVG